MPSRDPLLQQVLKQDLHRIFPEHSLFLVAVSGGADSMCLLSVLQSIAPLRDITLAVAHYHHGLRGDEADRDAAFVRAYCSRHHIPFYQEAGQVGDYAKANRLTIEEAARILRYDYLNRTAEALSGQRNMPCYIATAHNADDNAESILLHLVRGSGLQGLTGIAPRRGNLLRPLLECTRADIEAYNARNNIPFVQDSTNSDPAYSRNYLRHQVMPLLRQLNPNLAHTLGRTGKTLSLDHQFLQSCTQSALAAYVPEGTSLTLPVKALAELPAALQLPGIQLLYNRLIPDQVLSHQHRGAVLDLALGQSPSGCLHLPCGCTVRREYDALIFSTDTRQMPLVQPCLLPLPGEVTTGCYHLQAEQILYTGQQQQDFSLYLSTDLPCIGLRSRSTGDRLQPPKRPAKSLKKWMIEQKIPQPLRDTLPVLIDADHQVLAVPCLGVDEMACPSAGSPCWHITITKIGSNPL